MAKILAELIKPLDGDEPGTERKFTKPEFDKLRAQGAVRAVRKAKAAAKPQNKAAPKPENKSEG